MAMTKCLSYALVLTSLWATSEAETHPKEDLILCDCGIGDNKEQPDWSTSRQVNWYKDIKWPDSATSYPRAPDESVEVPFEEGIYPWTPEGATATLPNGDVWTVYIEDGTPDGFKAGTAVTTKEGGQTLGCWAYRGRPVSAAMNKTITEDAICWSAFVCNRDDHPPPRPDDLESPTSTPATTSAAPITSAFSTKPATTTTTEGEPAPTQAPQTGNMLVSAALNPRFLNWQNTWDAFIAYYAWDQNTGKCVGNPIIGSGYNISVECAGVQLDEDTHMTLLMIKALRDVGLNSLWFNQNPTVPPGTGLGANSTNWVVMPEAFSLTAVDAATSNTMGYISYTTHYDGFLAGPCSTCENGRFDKTFFDPVIGALKGSYPKFYSFAVRAECDPWTVCN
jgi:hypothetical protein